MRLIFIVTAVFLASCAAQLTPKAKKLLVVDTVSSELVSHCTFLGSVVGYATSGWGNEVGLQQAMNDALNKAAVIPGSTAFAVSSRQRSFTGGQVNGIVYDCDRQRIIPVEVVQDEKEVTTQDVFVKAKKCQQKGGVWVESKCVINVD